MGWQASRQGRDDQRYDRRGAIRRSLANSDGNKARRYTGAAQKKRHRSIRWRCHVWSRWQDSNLRPLGYEPNELAAAPHRNVYIIYYTDTIPKSSPFSNFFRDFSVQPYCPSNQIAESSVGRAIREPYFASRASQARETTVSLMISGSPESMSAISTSASYSPPSSAQS